MIFQNYPCKHGNFCWPSRSSTDFSPLGDCGYGSWQGDSDWKTNNTWWSMHTYASNKAFHQQHGGLLSFLNHFWDLEAHGCFSPIVVGYFYIMIMVCLSLVMSLNRPSTTTVDASGKENQRKSSSQKRQQISCSWLYIHVTLSLISKWCTLSYY